MKRHMSFRRIRQLILKSNPDVTHIHLSSIHFGKEDDGQPYIHLNNYYSENSKFDKVWKDLQNVQLKDEDVGRSLAISLQR